jgi:hypothetical protein
MSKCFARLLIDMLLRFARLLLFLAFPASSRTFLAFPDSHAEFLDSCLRFGIPEDILLPTYPIVFLTCPLGSIPTFLFSS